MKTAIYFSENNLQLVLTPENEFEKNLLKSCKEYAPEYAHEGQFYLNRAGYIVRSYAGYSSEVPCSLMLRFPKPTPEEPNGN